MLRDYESMWGELRDQLEDRIEDSIEYFEETGCLERRK